jgi:hypothetical protein
MLNELFKIYNTKKNDILEECEDLVENRKNEVYDLLDHTLKRGEKIDNLMVKADKLNDISFQMKSKTRSVKICSCLQNYYLILIVILLIISIIVTIVLGILFFVFKDKIFQIFKK